MRCPTIKKGKERKGFTLAEVLIVVTIIGILLAVAVPNVISYYRSLKLTELDDSARTIFMAAQNRLTAMKSAGEDLSTLSSITKEVPVSGGTAQVSAVTKSEKLDTLVLGGSIEAQLHSGNYVVEIDPKTGAVFAVWYWEKEAFDYQNESYDEVKPDKSDRLKAGRMVGYYGGSKVDRIAVNQMPIPELTLTNAEELRLTIKVPKITGAVAGFDSHIRVDVMVNGTPIVTGANLWNGGDPGTVVLDTLKSYTSKEVDPTAHTWTVGAQFKDWLVAGSSIQPGDNITVSVKLYYDGTVETGTPNERALLPQVISVETNSLFADVTEDAAGNKTAEIAYGRHLQNLDSAISGVDTSITAAEQTREIDFNKSAAAGADQITSWKDTYPAVSFISIYNENLTSYDGRSLPIRNLDAKENPDATGHTTDAGLFAYIESADLKDITLINAKVAGTDDVGALIGETADTVSVRGCKVYLEGYTVPASIVPYITSSGGGSVGGLIGSAGGTVTISNSFASTLEESTGNAGGLVGSADAAGTLKVEKSYAAGYLTGSNVGGLVGVTSGTVTVENSYAAGIIASATTTGGLIGNVDAASTTTISTSYAAVRYVTSGVSGANVYGVAPSAGGPTAYYIKQSGVTYQSNSGEEKNDAELKTALSSASWSTAAGETTAYGLTSETTGLVGTSYPYPMLFVTDSTGTPTTAVLPHYGDWLEETASASSLCYYEQVGGKYQVWGYLADSAGTLNPVNTLEKGTAGSGPFATEDGYCIPVLQGQPAPASVTVTSSTTSPAATTTKTYDKFTKIGTYTYGGNTYDLYKIDKLLDTTDGVKIDNDYYHEIDLGGAKYWFNPFFACEIQKDEPSDKTKPGAKDGAAGTGSTLSGNFSDQVVIRTARQLANLAKATGDTYEGVTSGSSEDAAQKRKYVQLLDIDYSEYKGTDLTVGKSDGARQSPAALDDSGSYDGNKFIIRNLYIDEGAQKQGTGLFGNTKGTLSNIRLVNVSVTSTSGDNNHTGALAGRFQGNTVTDCGVYVDNTTGNKPATVSNAYETFMVSRNSDKASTGGLIGSVKSGTTLGNCFAAVKVKGYDEVGGLIGKLSVDDTTSTLIDCYSGGHTDSGEYKLDSDGHANVSGNKQVGGLIGYVTGNKTVTLSGINYSTCSVSGAMPGSVNEIGLLIGAVETRASVKLDTTTTPASTAYATGKAFDGTGTEVNPRDETTGYSLITDLTNSAIKATAAKTTTPHPYDDHWKTATEYPYLSNLGDHHGDWVEKKNSVEACFYWEKEGSDYEVYVLGFETDGTTATQLNSGNAISTLCETHHTVALAMGDNATSNSTNDWGYGTIGLTDGLGTGLHSSVTDITTTASADLITALKAALTAYSVEDSDVKVYTGATENTSTNVASVADNTKTYHLNLGFGAAISMENNLGGTGNPYQIRNVQQLDNIQTGSSTYKQTHDLYGETYSSYTGASSFAGTYNGQSYRILKLSMTSGLFTSINGSATLDSIILYSTKGTTISGTNVGGIAGTVSGSTGDTVKITNCAVAGYTMSGTNVGGLVGEVSGGTLTIEKCEAVNTFTGTTGTTNYVGGLVGRVSSSNQLVVRYSYAGGEITGSATSVGGLLGCLDTGMSASYFYDYSYLNMTNTSANSCYAIGGTGNIGSCLDCCYLNNVTPLGKNPLDASASGLSGKSNYYLRSCMDNDTTGTFTNSRYPANPTGYKFDGSTADYPYPAVVKGYPDGTDGSTGTLQYVHYGDWPNS